jgi:hypothetical protein
LSSAKVRRRRSAWSPGTRIAAIALEPERYPHGIEPAEDLGAVVELQPAAERGIGPLDREHHQVGKTGEQRQAGDAEDRQPGQSETAQRAYDPPAGVVGSRSVVRSASAAGG